MAGKINRNTNDRRATAILRPLIYKYFTADVVIQKDDGAISGASELINNILDSHYNSLSGPEKDKLLKTFKNLNI